MASSATTVRVEGLRDLQRALRRYDSELAKRLTVELKAVADIVRQSAVMKFSSINAKAAAGFRPRARAGVAAVEQSKKRTTGRRPDFGRLQMTRALLPALDEHQDDVLRELENMLDRLADREGF